MYFQIDHYWFTILHYLKSSPLIQQVAPLVVLFLIPCLALTAQAHWKALVWLISMVFENLGLGFVWNWAHNNRTVNGIEVPDSFGSSDRRKGRRKRHARSGSDEAIERVGNGSTVHHDDDSTESTNDDDDPYLYYPGLVNISGTYCFMNSVLQAMASLAYLKPYVENIQQRAEELDVPTPVIDALRDALQALNTPKTQQTSLRPVPMINALSAPSGSSKNRSALFSSREHQDAQEFFQLLSECIKNESEGVEKEEQRDRGLGGLTSDDEFDMLQSSMFIGGFGGESSKGVFDGLTANRRSCRDCGYTEAVMHFAFDNWQLALPRLTSTCSLEDCLADYIRLEPLDDCICRKCSIIATHEKLVYDVEKLNSSVTPDHPASHSKKRRIREAKKLEARVKAAIEEGRIEDDIRGVVLEKVFKRSTKQAMIARPPPVLALHLNRSMHYGSYAAKNSCRVVFPEILDITRFTTSGQLNTNPETPISTPPFGYPLTRSTTPTQASYAFPRVLYRLSAIVCHYGAHSFGHYVSYRRKPRLSKKSGSHPSYLTTPKLSCPLHCECRQCNLYGPVRDDERPPRPGRGWLRMSDDAVVECGIEKVLGEGSGVFMLFYERVAQPRPSVYLPQRLSRSYSPRSSEETVKGVQDIGLGNGFLNGSSLSISTFSATSASVYGDFDEPIIGPRVLTSATVGRRSRSLSVPPRPNAERQTSHEPSAGEPSSLPLSGPNGNLRANGFSKESLNILPSTPLKRMNGDARPKLNSPRSSPLKPIEMSDDEPSSPRSTTSSLTSPRISPSSSTNSRQQHSPALKTPSSLLSQSQSQTHLPGNPIVPDRTVGLRA